MAKECYNIINMKRAELYSPYDSGPDLKEVDIDIGYSIPFEWGDLYVSKTANEAYGLVPLTTNTKPGYSVQESTDITLRTRIFLLTPGELAMPTGIESGVAFTHPNFNKKGLEYQIALGDTKTTMSEALNNMLLEATGHDQETLDQFVDQNDIPISERLDNDTPQFIIHNLKDAIETNVTEYVTVWLRAEANHNFYSRVKQIGGLALLGVGVGVLPLAVNHKFEPFDFSVAGGIVAIQAGSFRSLIRKKVTRANKDEYIYYGVAKDYAGKIASDIHEAYCSVHFNRRLEEQL